MEKKKFELEVIKGVEKIETNSLEYVKGGLYDLDDPENLCCLIQISCNNKCEGNSMTGNGNPRTISIQ